MKRISLTLIAFMATIISVTATVITVSNTANSPGMYNNIQDAVDNSAPEDTILIAGSATSYGDATVSWPLTLIGAGYNNPYGENTKLGLLFLVRIGGIGASGCNFFGIEFSGIYFQGSFPYGNITNQKIDNVLFERCKFTSYITFSERYCSFSNDTIRNCLFQVASSNTGFNFYGLDQEFSEIMIHNNIFDGGYFYVANDVDISSVYIKNNIFINGTTALFRYNPSSSANNRFVVNNNIFYGVWPEGCDNCTFNNNITYLCDDNQLIYSGNPGSVGSGNILNTDPKLINFPFVGGAFDYSYDLGLQGTSPGINAGTDGSNIGVDGGLLPFEEPGANPAIPQMISVTFPGASSVGVGGTLNVTFESAKQD